MLFCADGTDGKLVNPKFNVYFSNTKITFN